MSELAAFFGVAAMYALPLGSSFADVPDVVDPSVYVPAVAGYYTAPNGQMLSFPFNSSTTIFYFNKDAFKAAGIDNPSYTGSGNRPKPDAIEAAIGRIGKLVADRALLREAMDVRAEGGPVVLVRKPQGFRIEKPVADRADRELTEGLGSGADPDLGRHLGPAVDGPAQPLRLGVPAGHRGLRADRVPRRLRQGQESAPCGPVR